MSKPTVTLCMIVKDEEHIIHECLDSMAKYVDRFDITDTGSSDKTKEIIKEWGEKNNIPGTVHEMEWKGFGKSRTQSLKNAESSGADFAWVIDADDKVIGDFTFPNNMEQYDAVALNISRGGINWWRNQIFKLSSGWEYVGVLHEYADCIGLREKEQVPKCHQHNGDYAIDARTMGNRTKEFGDDQSAKYTRDAETLVDCLTNPDNENYEPDNHRYHFYCGQSYFDAGNFEEAYPWYQKRAELGGWEEEVWYSVYRMGMCLMNEPHNKEPGWWAKAQDHLLKAYELRPHRAEPLVTLSRIHRLNGNPRLGYLFAKIACAMQKPQNDMLFIQGAVYEWEALDEVSATAYTVGDWHTGFYATKKLLEDNLFPEEHRERIMTNYQSYHNWMVQNGQLQQQHLTETDEQKEKRTELRKARQEQMKKEKSRKKRRLNKRSRSA